MLVQGRNGKGPHTWLRTTKNPRGLLVAHGIPVHFGSGARTFRTPVCHNMNNSLVPCRPEPDLGAIRAGWAKILTERELS